MSKPSLHAQTETRLRNTKAYTQLPGAPASKHKQHKRQLCNKFWTRHSQLPNEVTRP
jgi:hypothetical protein